MTSTICSKCGCTLTTENVADYLDDQFSYEEPEELPTVHQAILAGHLFCHTCYEEEYYEICREEALQRYNESNLEYMPI